MRNTKDPFTFRIESPTLYFDNQAALIISGFLITENKKINSINIYIENSSYKLGKKIGSLTYGYKRSDVFEVYKKNLFCGFYGNIYLYQDKHVKLKLFAAADGVDQFFLSDLYLSPIKLKRFKFILWVKFFWFCSNLFFNKLYFGRLSKNPKLLWLKFMNVKDRFFLNNSTSTSTSKYLSNPYLDWRHKNSLTPNLIEAMKKISTELEKKGPLISIVVPVFNPNEQYLEAMINSVIDQIYSNWELILVDDASKNFRTVQIIKEYSQKDSRIKFISNKVNKNISITTNRGISFSNGSYIAFLDHDDLLSKDALFHFVRALKERPKLEWLYSDEDKIDYKGEHFDPIFKSDWSPEMAICHNYTHHLTVVKKTTLNKLNGLTKGLEGAQDLDLNLRLAEVVKISNIAHIPFVCYSWRAHSQSTASSGLQKSYIYEAAKKSISNSFARRKLKAEVFLPEISKENHFCLYQPKWNFSLIENSPVTILIPTKDKVNLLKECISSILKTVNTDYVKLIIINDYSSNEETLKYFKYLTDQKILSCKVIKPKDQQGVFNYASLINEGAKHVTTPLMLHLNNDIKAINKGWLEDMVGWMSIESVGAVGAKLVYPNNTIQHAGVVVGPHSGLADHAFHSMDDRAISKNNLSNTARNVSAVTGACLLTSTNLFKKLGGFDEKHFAVSYNDVDYCLRLIKNGKRIVYTPQAKLIHHESLSRGKSYNPKEHINFLNKYSEYKDLFFNCNLDLSSMQFEVDPEYFSYGSLVGEIRVLFISHNFNLGGAPIVLSNFAKFFSKKCNVNVAVLSPYDGPLRKIYHQFKIKSFVHTFPDNMNLMNQLDFNAFLKKLGDKINIKSYDLIVTNTLETFWGVELAHIHNKPVLWNIHESIPLSNFLSRFKSPYIQKLITQAFADAYKVIFQSSKTMDIFKEYNTKSNFSLIPGGLPIDEIEIFKKSNTKSLLRKKYNLPVDATIVSIIGTTCERKGQHIFIESVIRLYEQNSSLLKKSKTLFLIVGAIEGPYLKYLESLISKNKLNEILVINETETIYDYFYLSDLFICSSYIESFPMVILLAMAFEIPILSTNVYGIPEIINDGHDGKLYKAGDSNALANLIKNFLENPASYRKIAAYAYAKIIRLHDNNKLLKKYYEILREAALS